MLRRTNPVQPSDPMPHPIDGSPASSVPPTLHAEIRLFAAPALAAGEGGSGGATASGWPASAYQVTPSASSRAAAWNVGDVSGVPTRSPKWIDIPAWSGRLTDSL